MFVVDAPVQSMQTSACFDIAGNGINGQYRLVIVDHRLYQPAQVLRMVEAEQQRAPTDPTPET